MGILDAIFGARKDNHNGSDGVAHKLDELAAQVKKLDGTHRESAHHIMRELRELKSHESIGKEEVIRRIESVQEKLQFATEEYVATDEDVKQMVRNCLKTRAKTFNEVQKETKISPQTLMKYLRMMKGEIEEFNGVYRIVFSSSLVYIGKGSQAGEGQIELAETEALGTEFSD